MDNKFDLNDIKGIIFDYGGTIDSNGKHWAEVLWESYEDIQIPITKEQFREAYVYGERHLATHPVIKPNDTFFDLLKVKIRLQLEYAYSKNFLTSDTKTKEYNLAVSTQCYNFVKDLISKEKPYLEQMHAKYPMVLVSNFYGNVQAVLQDFGLIHLFGHIVESAVVGVRKPDPRIFAMGVEKLNMAAENIVVIGDSYAKDIVPARKNGCKTIWLRGLGWEKDDDDATADIVISDFMELKDIFQLQ